MIKAMRHDGRKERQLRTLRAQLHSFGFGAGSVLFECGQTKVLCSVSMQNGVPPFLRGKGNGWLTAEYAMLPTATQERTTRESCGNKRNGRAVEISRLIGRVFRAVVDLTVLGEQTITIDCDVLQADGSTRVASICGAYLALHQAQTEWLKHRVIARPFLKEMVAAVAVGIQDQHVLLDPDYLEDSTMQADFNFVMTRSGKLIEVLGGAEVHAIEWDLFEHACSAGRDGVDQLFGFFDELLSRDKDQSPASPLPKQDQAPLFSLARRKQSMNVYQP